MENPILKLHQINKDFSGIQVLYDINIDIKKGEVLGVLGENGAGKSTLLKIISGIYQLSSGEIFLDGTKVEISDPIKSKALGISMIPQEFNLVDSLNVFENIYLGSELKSWGILDKHQMRKNTAQLLLELETDISPDVLIANLSVAEKQMVEIAKALTHDSRILIMDEPTTVLTNQEVAILFKLIEKLKTKKVTIIFISHKLKEIKQICDRLIILRDGHLISVHQVKDINEETMARNMVGRELTQIYPEKNIPEKETVFEIENLSDGFYLKNISFKLKKGEVLGFAGLIGAGRTEIFESVMGLRSINHGTIKVNGQKLSINGPEDAIANRIAYLSEDRQGKGLIMDFNVPENITLVSLKKYIKIIINKSMERDSAHEYIKQFDIKAASLDTPLIKLSGGNQQKVYLSKWMDTKPEILILDEPTRGIDINTKKEIYHFISSLTDQGISVIVISSELEEVIGLCNRVLVMRSGSIVGELGESELSEENIMLLAAGIDTDRNHKTDSSKYN